MKDLGKENALREDNSDPLFKLQSYIDSLKSCISLFEGREEKTCILKQQFFDEYILLEDKILNELEVFKMNGLVEGKIEYLVEEFTKFWNEYQDSWSDENWKIYEIKRTSIENEEEFCMNFNRENNASCNFIFEKKKDEYDSHSNHSNLSTNIGSNGVNSPKSALKQIDDEISQVNDIPLNKGKESNLKNRTCLNCIVF